MIKALILKTHIGEGNNTIYVHSFFYTGYHGEQRKREEKEHAEVT